MSERINSTPETKQEKSGSTPSRLAKHALDQLVSTEVFREDAVEKLFHDGTLLVRGLDSPRLYKDGNAIGLDYGTIDYEMNDIQEEPLGLSYASSTLLLPEKRIPTYKSFGFMFDARKSALHHLFPQDSASNGQEDDFRAAESSITSLEQLASVIKEESAPKMNEVVGSFKADSLVGLFAVEAPRPTAKIDAWFMQQHLKHASNVELPLYIYSVDKGAIKLVAYSTDEIRELINQGFRSGSSQYRAYSRALEFMSV